MDDALYNRHIDLVYLLEASLDCECLLAVQNRNCYFIRSSDSGLIVWVTGYSAFLLLFS